MRTIGARTGWRTHKRFLARERKRDLAKCGPVKTLAQMSPTEVAELERLYCAQVKPPR